MNSLTIAKLLLGVVLLHPSVQAQAVPENAAFAVDDNANKLAIPTGSGNGWYTYIGGVIAPTAAGEIRRLYLGTTVEPLYFCFMRIEPGTVERHSPQRHDADQYAGESLDRIKLRITLKNLTGREYAVKTKTI